MPGLSSFVRSRRQAQHLGDIAHNHLAENARIQAVERNNKLRFRWHFPLRAGQIGATQRHLVRILSRTNIEQRRTAAWIVDRRDSFARDHRCVERNDVVLLPTRARSGRTTRRFVQPQILHPHRQRGSAGSAVVAHRRQKERAAARRWWRALLVTVDNQGGIGVRSRVTIHPAGLLW